MPAKLSDTATRTDSWMISPEEVVPNREIQGRCKDHTEESVKTLAENMHAVGQKQPALVRKLGNGVIELVFGYRRWLAVQYIRKHLDPGFMLWVKSVKLNDKEAFISNVTENKMRLATTPIDDAVNAEKLQGRHGCTREETAKILGCTVQWLGSLEQLLLLPDDLRDKVADGTLPVEAALTTVKLGSEEAMRQAVADATEVKNGKTKVSTKKVKATARDKGARVGRTLGDLKKALKDVNSPRSEAILRFLRGEVGERGLANALKD